MDVYSIFDNIYCFLTAANFCLQLFEVKSIPDTPSSNSRTRRRKEVNLINDNEDFNALRCISEAQLTEVDGGNRTDVVYAHYC